jgi:hypothetical protein
MFLNEDAFLTQYLKPGAIGVKPPFRFALPPVPGLVADGECLLHFEQGETWSVNFIARYRSPGLKLTLRELYKNTQHRKTGVFIRLVGPLSFTLNGYPGVSMDCPVLNVDPASGQKCQLSTRVVIHLPLASRKQSDLFINGLRDRALSDGLEGQVHLMDRLPPWWGQFLVFNKPGLQLEIIQRLRDHAWGAYETMASQTPSNPAFNYMPFQEYMVFDTARREHGIFASLGFSVSAEAQMAFFSAMSTLEF